MEKKWKKTEKELDIERKQCQGFVKELAGTTQAYSTMSKENEQLRKEADMVNTNFNKIYKEKNADKFQADQEIQKL